MTKIFLHGNLGEKFGTDYDLQVASPAEALKALACFKPGFISEITTNHYGIMLGDKETGIPLSDVEEFHIQTGRDIHIIPVLEGADPGTVTAAITVAVQTFFASIPFLGPTAAYYGAAATMYLGTSLLSGLLIAGVSSLLSPQAKEEGEAPETLFSNSIGTARQGGSIPVLYGEDYCDLVPISAIITSTTAHPTAVPVFYTKFLNND